MSRFNERLILSIGSINLDVYLSDLSDKCFLGGSSLNTAHFLQNLLENKKFKIIPIGLIGNDEIGKRILEMLKIKNFTTDFIKIVEGVSGKTAIHLDRSGERTIIREKSVNSRLNNHIKDMIAPFIDKKPLIHIKADLKVAQKILETTDSIFSADISGFLKINKEEIEKMSIGKMFQNKSINILLGNLQEYLELMNLLEIYPIKSEVAKLEDMNDHFGLLKKIFHSEWIFIKQGSKGASVFFNNHFIHQDAPVVKVVDTTGAGDAFNAGVIYGIVNSIKDPSHILEIAITVGSFKCTALGGQEFCNFDQLKEKIKLINKKYKKDG